MNINIIDYYLDFVKKNVHQYSKMIIDKEYVKEIIDSFLKVYIDYVFYDFYTTNDEIKALKFKDVINDKKKELFDSGLYTEDVINDNYLAFVCARKLLVLDKYNDELMIKINTFRFKLGLKKNDKLKELVIANINKLKAFFDSFSSQYFYLNEKKTNIVNLYNCIVEHNISFPEIYSSMAIRNAYNKDLVSEQKVFICFYMVSYEILRSILDNKTLKTYLVDFDSSLFTKALKVKRALKFIDNNILRENVVMKITYKQYLENVKVVNNFVKEGYKYAIIIDDTYQNNEKNLFGLSLFSYIIINNHKYYYDEFKNMANIVEI